MTTPIIILVGLLIVAAAILYHAHFSLATVKGEALTALSDATTEVHKLDAEVLAELEHLENIGRVATGSVATYIKAHLFHLTRNVPAAALEESTIITKPVAVEQPAPATPTT